MDLRLLVRGEGGRPIRLEEALRALGLDSSAPPPSLPAPRAARDTAAGGRAVGATGSSVEVGRAETGATLLIEAGPPPTAATRHGEDAGGSPAITIRAPLLRAPWFAEDALGPAVAALCAAGATLHALAAPSATLAPGADFGPSLDEQAARDLWRDERSRALQDLALLCEETGVPLPPHLPASDLAALQAWLIVAAAAAGDTPPAAFPLLCLDARAGDPPRCAAALPANGRVRVPPGFDLIWTRSEHTVVVHYAALPTRPSDPRGLLLIDLDEDRALLDQAAGEPLDAFRALAPVEVLDEESLRRTPSA